LYWVPESIFDHTGSFNGELFLVVAMIGFCGLTGVWLNHLMYGIKRHGVQ
jgi:hypothetical protein